MQEQKFWLVATHGGAGYHHKAKDLETNIRDCLTRAMKDAFTSIEAGSTALDATEQIITMLEDDPCLNAGFGSNLTFDGTVECDASIMDGRTADYGAVGAVSGIKNPIRAATAVLRHSRQPDPLGRIRPILLVSEGARSFAEEHHLPCVSPDALISVKAKAEWSMWKERYEAATTDEETVTMSREGLHDRQDTVGAIAWDASGGLAAGVSRKPSGRVGEAAMFGAGCWAQQVKDSGSERGVACSISGSGEYITRMMLAKTIGEAIIGNPDPDVHQILTGVLEDFHCDRGEAEPSAGVLLVVQEPNEEGGYIPRLWCAFTTESMAVAYGTSSSQKLKVPASLQYVASY
ncbi:nucleophile aminohydrolase [Irpex rosettiformis]|uniref:Nucleophile aminohydrolase n=1 Tax=Irpex rosettiformis TaxID=378272 RepID=A0ACB8UG02_9APHY|nr:nucleophile aminohydrolase [Irpex rosettiformis]